MDSNSKTASPSRSFRRVLGKLCQLFARKLPFLPGKYRSLLQSLHGVKIEDWRSTFIGENVYFDDISPCDISVGRNTRITANVRILTHYFDTRYQPTPSRPFRFFKGVVSIGQNVFIGSNTVIANPVNIGNGAIIGANSVITRDIPANAIAAGCPAKVIGERPPMLGELV
jgi:acetyltransferase-like isoleucine patch superfamily enzyme